VQRPTSKIIPLKKGWLNRDYILLQVLGHPKRSSGSNYKSLSIKLRQFLSNSSLTPAGQFNFLLIIYPNTEEGLFPKKGTTPVIILNTITPSAHKSEARLAPSP